MPAKSLASTKPSASMSASIALSIRVEHRNLSTGSRRVVALPQGFPAAFPLPPNTVVIGSEQRSENRVIVTAISADSEKEVLSFLQKELPQAGYTLSNGEVESGDAESDWTATGWHGRWAIREIPGCDRDTVITVLAAPA
jgi:hypothetical protein